MKNTLRSLAIGAFSLMMSNIAGAQYIIHIAGNNKTDHSGDGTAARHASLRCPTSICRDNFGNLYIADGGPIGYENDGCIRRISSLTGEIITIAGLRYYNDSTSNTADGIPALTAKLNGAAGICIDKKGNILVADGHGAIRKINSGGIITTIAGNKTIKGYSGDGGPATAALMNGPCDITVDAINNIYVADMNNHVIRKIDTFGVIRTVAGNGNMGSTGDGGPAVNARLNQPHGIFIDNSGNMLIADYNNHRIRRVSASGVITTIAGSVTGFSGDGGPATAALLAQPVRVIMDGLNNIYISDAANQRIRKIEGGTGIIRTIAGNGTYFSGIDTVGNNGGALNASLIPHGLALDPCDNLYVGGVMYSVRAIVPLVPENGLLCGTMVNSVSSVNGPSTGELLVFPDPNSGDFTVRMPSGTNEPMQIIVTDITGRKIMELAGNTNKDANLHLNSTPGLYIVQVTSGHGSWSRKVVVQ